MLQDITRSFLQKATLQISRPEHIPDLICRNRQNEVTEEYVPNERQGNNHRKKLNEMEISIMPDKGFNVMVKKIFSGQERVNALSENLESITKRLEGDNK